jgi:hypothetical protein
MTKRPRRRAAVKPEQNAHRLLKILEGNLERE